MTGRPASDRLALSFGRRPFSNFLILCNDYYNYLYIYIIPSETHPPPCLPCALPATRHTAHGTQLPQVNKIRYGISTIWSTTTTTRVCTNQHLPSLHSLIFLRAAQEPSQHSTQIPSAKTFQTYRFNKYTIGVFATLLSSLPLSDPAMQSGPSATV